MNNLLLILTLILVYSCRESNPKNISKNTLADTSTLLNNANTIDSNLNLKEGKIIKFTSRYSFDSFRVEVYNGKLAQPSFIGNPFSKDKKYVNFITEGCNKNKINFAGHYTIIQQSCGAMCEYIFIVNRINGKIFTDIKPNDGRYGYLYYDNSNMLIANSSVFQDDSLKYYNNFFGEPELYLWTGTNFKLLQ